MFKFRPIELQEGNRVPSRVQLLRTGTFNYDGEDLVIDEKLLASLHGNFVAKVRGYQDGQLPLDYFHEGDRLAAGWISALYLEENGTELWADVKWTPKASEMIAGGELRYLSVEFAFEYRDNESGKSHGPTLFGAGLTNRPFIKGMKPVVEFSEKSNGGKSAMTLEQALAQIAEMKSQIAALTEAMKSHDTEKKQLSEQVTKLQGEKAEADKAAKLAEKKGAFDKMLSEGKAVEAQREAFMSGDMAKFAELAKPINTAGIGSAGDAGAEGSKKFTDSPTPAQDEVLELARTVAKEKNVSLREAISIVLKANKTLSEKYSAEVKIA